MNFVIRKADSKDASGIARVHVETWQSHYRGLVPDEYLSNMSLETRTKRWTEGLSHLKPQQTTFVAEQVGNIIGFCDVGRSRDSDASEYTGELYAIYLFPSAQGHGIGSALMDAGLRFLGEEGFKTATLWVLQTNASAISFYRSKGWKDDGQQKREEKEGFTFEETRYRISL